MMAIFTVACDRNAQNAMSGPPPTPVSEDNLAAAAQQICAGGQVLRELKGGATGTMGSFALPPVVAFVHARGRCALVEDIHEGSLLHWLSFKLPGNCLPNGALWTPVREHIQHGVRWTLTPVDGAQGAVIIDSNEEMPVSHIEKTTGMALFYCGNPSLMIDDVDPDSLDGLSTQD